jgi:hypothetical protein
VVVHGKIEQSEDFANRGEVTRAFTGAAGYVFIEPLFRELDSRDQLPVRLFPLGDCDTFLVELSWIAMVWDEVEGGPALERHETGP